MIAEPKGRLIMVDHELTYPLDGHEAGVVAIVVSPDLPLVATCSRDNTIGIWDASSGTLTLITTLTGHTDAVLGCAFDPDGRYMVSYSADLTLRVWRRSGMTFTPGRVLEGHTDIVTHVYLPPGSPRFLSASRDQTVRLWEYSIGAEISVLRGHTDWVNCVKASRDGRQFISCSEDRTVKIWDPLSTNCIDTLYGDAPFVSLTVADDMVFAGDRLGAVWALNYRRRFAEFRLPARIFLLAASADRDLAEYFEVALGREYVRVIDIDAEDDPESAASLRTAQLLLVLVTRNLIDHRDSGWLDRWRRRESAGVPLYTIWESESDLDALGLQNSYGFQLRDRNEPSIREVVGRLHDEQTDRPV
jgi:WD40 repeat protein